MQDTVLSAENNLCLHRPLYSRGGKSMNKQLFFVLFFKEQLMKML